MTNMANFIYTEGTPKKANKATPVLFVQRQIFKIPGNTIRVFDKHKHLLMKARIAPFRLREKVKLYSDEAQTSLVATAEAKKVVDYNATFEIKSSEEGQLLGSIKRSGLKSELYSDTWQIFNNKGEEVAVLSEPKIHYSLIRRWLLPFLPQSYQFELTDKSIALSIEQEFIPYVLRYRVYCTDYRRFTAKVPEKLLCAFLCTIAAIEQRS